MFFILVPSEKWYHLAEPIADRGNAGIAKIIPAATEGEFTSFQ
jgi:hypothetical protein